jgi:hypothetical protein
MTIDLEQRIRERAYQIWEQEGRIDGRADQHWQMAKLELTNADEALSAPHAIEAPSTTAQPAQPAKKSRRASTAKTAPVSAVAPRRRRTTATLQ